MAINLDDRYPGRANGKTLSYPQGSFKNRTSPTSKDGTYLEQDWANDWAAFFQSMMKDASLTANGDVDTVGTSQYFNALIGVVQNRTALVLPTAPASKLSNVIYVEDRERHLHWKTIGTFTGYVDPMVGCFEWGTQPSVRPWQADLNGQTLDHADPMNAALYAWANATGRFVTSANWVVGAYNFCEMGGTLFRIPDIRNQFIRATGTDVDTANARALGSLQLDALQRITGRLNHGVQVGSIQSVSGAFSPIAAAGTTPAAQQYPSGTPFSQAYAFDSGLVTRASTETRPCNTAYYPRIHV